MYDIQSRSYQQIGGKAYLAIAFSSSSTLGAHMMRHCESRRVSGRFSQRQRCLPFSFTTPEKYGIALSSGPTPPRPARIRTPLIGHGQRSPLMGKAFIFLSFVMLTQIDDYIQLSTCRGFIPPRLPLLFHMSLHPAAATKMPRSRRRRGIFPVVFSQRQQRVVGVTTRCEECGAPYILAGAQALISLAQLSRVLTTRLIAHSLAL